MSADGEWRPQKDDRSSPKVRSCPSTERRQFRAPREKEKDRPGGVPVTFRYRYIPNYSPEETERDGVKWTELACGWVQRAARLMLVIYIKIPTKYD